MTFYALIKFLHLAGAFVMFAALGVEFRVLRGMSLAQTPGEARAALAGLRAGQRIGAPGVLLLLVAATYLAWDAWGMPAWLAASIAALLAIPLMEGLVTRRLLAAFERTLAARTPGSESQQRVRSLKSAYYARVLVLAAIVALMVIKPGALGAAAILVAVGLIAAIVGPRVRSGGRSIEHSK